MNHLKGLSTLFQQNRKPNGQNSKRYVIQCKVAIKQVLGSKQQYMCLCSIIPDTLIVDHVHHTIAFRHKRHLFFPLVELNVCRSHLNVQNNFCNPVGSNRLGYVQLLILSSLQSVVMLRDYIAAFVS